MTNTVIRWCLPSFQRLRHRARSPLSIISLPLVVWLRIISNSSSVGGFKGITGEDVDLSDGLFEVTLIKEPPVLQIELGGILMAVMNRKLHSDYVVSFKTDRLVITSDEGLSWTRDGEFGGSHNRTVIFNKRIALDFIVP